MTDPTPHLERFKSYQEACREFHWQIPERFNIASAIFGRHTDAATRIALSEAKPAGTNTYTFGGLDFLSDKFAMSLSECGIAPGDTVAVALPASAALAVAQLGTLKAGGVVVPLSTSHDASLLRRIIVHSRARVIVVDESLCLAVESLAEGVDNLEQVYVARDLRLSSVTPKIKDFWTEVDRSSSDFTSLEADAQSHAFVFYVDLKDELTSIVHSHAALIGNLGAFEMLNNLEQESSSRFWASDDWSSPTVLLGLLYPLWWYGSSVVASGPGNDVFGMIRRYEVTHAFCSAPALPDLMQLQPGARIASTPSSLVTDALVSRPLRDWTSHTFGGNVAGIWSRPEIGVAAGTCDPWYSTLNDSIGRLVPGRRIEVVDEDTHPVPTGERGNIAVHTSDPALFLRYDNQEPKTGPGFFGDWFLTGAIGHKNAAGDVFVTSAVSAKE